ncbi:ORF36 [Ranid herpesvirus 1]|uniref:ORF36 n=1 Tax=Ranid herpesvirus 1 TaxID=85655 RepID=Q14VS2_9VIRU|nr:ORF36 [Ranid herpesvirus 1]ABG25734.1 ORF36 [Ranid herpesvirus 1]
MLRMHDLDFCTFYYGEAVRNWYFAAGATAQRKGCLANAMATPPDYSSYEAWCGEARRHLELVREVWCQTHESLQWIIETAEAHNEGAFSSSPHINELTARFYGYVSANLSRSQFFVLRHAVSCVYLHVGRQTLSEAADRSLLSHIALPFVTPWHMLHILHVLLGRTLYAAVLTMELADAEAPPVIHGDVAVAVNREPRIALAQILELQEDATVGLMSLEDTGGLCGGSVPTFIYGALCASAPVRFPTGLFFSNPDILLLSHCDFTRMGLPGYTSILSPCAQRLDALTPWPADPEMEIMRKLYDWYHVGVDEFQSLAEELFIATEGLDAGERLLTFAGVASLVMQGKLYVHSSGAVFAPPAPAAKPTPALLAQYRIHPFRAWALCGNIFTVAPDIVVHMPPPQDVHCKEQMAEEHVCGGDFKPMLGRMGSVALRTKDGNSTKPQ